MDALNDFQPLLNAGVQGAVLWWFMKSNDRRLQRIEEKQELSVRAITVLTLSLPTAPEAAKRESRQILSELEALNRPQATPG